MKTFTEKKIFLAPLAGYTDFVFRKIVRSIYLEGATTEMVSVVGLVYGDEESWRMVNDVKTEKDTGIQLFGSHPEYFEKAMRRIESRLIPPFFDLNAGCPVKKVTKKGAGAALLKDLPRLKEILYAMKETSSVPVTLKTRLGWDHEHIVIEKILETAKELGLQWVTIHGRMRNQMYRGDSDLSFIVRLAEESDIPVIANGDIRDRKQVGFLLNETGLHGVSIGRAALGRPWLFYELRGGVLTEAEKLKIILRHLEENVDYYGEKKGILRSIPHLVRYVKAVPRASYFRDMIVREKNYQSMKKILMEAFGYYEKIT